MPWEAMNHHHPTTAVCMRGTSSNIRQLEEEEAWAVAATAFRVYVHPLETVKSFKYIERLITATDDDWPEVIINLHKLQKSWYRMSKILRR